MPRLLLLETLHDDPHRHHGAEYFPHLLGLAREAGWDAQWWTVPVPKTHMHVGGRFIVDLPPGLRGRLGAALCAWPPDVVVLPYRPTEALRAAIVHRVPAMRFFDLTEKFVPASYGPALIGTATRQRRVARALFDPTRPSSEALPTEGLLGDAPPRFGRRWLGGGTPSRSFYNIRIAVEPGCPYQGSLSRLPAYRDLVEDGFASWRGCTFCSKRIRGGFSQDVPFARSAVERALAQVVAHQRDEPPGGERCQYVFDYGLLTVRFRRLLEGVVDASLAPSTFVTMMRADALVARRADWEALLPRLRDAGHRLALISVGAENFSAAENERFNKGVTSEQLWDCVDLLENLGRRYPGVIESQDPGYFSAIVFTPWTTPEDLRENVRAGRRLGAVWLNRVLGTRLQLWAGTPIAALAERDGLTSTTWFADGPRIVATSAAGPDDRELPWRFADPRTRALHRLLIRLSPISPKVRLDADDPLVAKLAAARARLPRRLADDYVALVSALVDAVEAEGDDAPLETLFSRCGVGVEEEPAPEEPGKVPTDESRGAPCLVFTVGPPGKDAARYDFRVFPHRKGRPHFRREGRLALVHGDHPFDRPAEIFAAALRRAMRELQHALPGPDTLATWRKTVATILARARLDAQFSWSVEAGQD